MSESVYGIDLGTTNSAIAVYENEEARILKNIDGFEITPSVVFFTGKDAEGNDESLVGNQAKNAAATDPDNVIQFVKRRMGFSGPSYNYIAPSGKEYTPEMISALILRKLCSDAEQFVGDGSIRNVVITVPAYFDDARRTATKQAGKIAGLNVLSVINEPTAAAIAYGFNTEQKGRILVYDLGGGTFDVTVMDVHDGVFDVLATGGDPQLGGVNYDQKILGLIIKKLEEQGCEIDDEDDALYADIREKAEKVKKQLSNIETARPAFSIGGKTYRTEITREEFEKESESLMQRTQFLLDEVMKEKNLSWSDIDQLLVVGGSTRMPMVRKLLEQISGKEISYKVDPDTAVAQGAAIFASTLETAGDTEASAGTDSGTHRGIPGKITVSDVTSQSLGIITVDSSDYRKRVNTIIIPHNTKIPTRKSEIFYTIRDNQRQLEIEVTEGDDTDVEYVKVVGSATLSIPEYPKDSPVEVIYAYDPDQTIYIEVIDKVTDKSLGQFEIDRASNLTEEQVENATGIVGRATVD
ncbi:MAG: Hsp70 family protein [Eubacterium sp.]|nr:Hsp70 family protein [Eubacterium sp.]